MILITGATGVIGGKVLDELIGQAPIRVLVRSDSAARTMAGREGVQVARGDLRAPDTLGEAFSGVSRLFLLSPSVSDQASLEHNALQAAVAAGVRRIVYLSAIDVDWGIELSRAHRSVERALAISSVAHTVIRPEYLLDNLLMEVGSISSGELVAPTGTGRCAFVDGRDVAAVAAAELISERPARGAVQVTGPSDLSWQELAGLLGTTLGHAVRHVDQDPVRWRRAAVQMGMSSWLAGALCEYFQVIPDHPMRPTGDVLDITGRPARTVEQFAREVFAPAAAANVDS